MAQKIQGSDFLQAGLFDQAIEDVKKFSAAVDSELKKVSGKIAEVGKQMGTAMSGMGGVDYAKNTQQLDTYVKSIDGLKEKQKQLTDAEKEAARIAKEVESAKAALQKQRDKAYQAIAKEEQKQRELVAAANMEVKSIQDLKTQNAALVKLRDRVNLKTKEGATEYQNLTKRIKDNDTQLKKHDEEIGRHQRNVGNYKSALAGVGSAFMRLAGAMGFTVGAFKIFKGIIFSTQAVGDAFTHELSAMREGFSFLARSISTLDFSNLINGFNEAAREGRRYSRELDEIADRQRALGIQQDEIELQIIRQRTIARDRTLDLKEREAAIDEIIRLEGEKLTISKEFSNRVLENELENASKRSKLNKDEIKDFISNYNEYSDALTRGTELQKQLKEQNTKTYLSRSGLYVSTLDVQKYNDAVENLNETERQAVRIAELSNLIDEDKRVLLAKAIQDDIKADVEQAAGMERIVGIRSRLIKELIKQEDETRKLTDITENETDTIEKQITKLNKLTRSQTEFYQNEIRERNLLSKSGVSTLQEYTNAEDEEYSKSYEYLQAQLDNKEISQTEYNVRLNQLRQEETDNVLQTADYYRQGAGIIAGAFAEQTAAHQAAVIAERLAALTELSIQLGLIKLNILSGTSKTLSYGFPANIPLIAAFIAQIAGLYDAAKSIKFRKGGSGLMTDSGFVLEGASHEGGGVPLSNVEAEGGEYLSVFNRQATRKHRKDIALVTELFNKDMFHRRFQQIGADGSMVFVNQADPYNKKIYDTLRNKKETQTSIQGNYMIVKNGNYTQRLRVN